MRQRIRTYQDAAEFLFNRINYEKRNAQSYGPEAFKLERMQTLLRQLGNPQLDTPTIHIAGTKGKGTTAAICASILRAAGYRTGLFVSPHIARFEERLTLNGELPTEDQVVALAEDLNQAVGQMTRNAPELEPTFFELVTAMAWLHFSRSEAKFAVIEVGLGGRLDSTNVCSPKICVITSISRDHTALLGQTTTEIAAEKGGIIKPGVPVISGVDDEDAQRVIAEIAAEQGTKVYCLGREFNIAWEESSDEKKRLPGLEGEIDYSSSHWQIEGIRLPLAGAHQARNAAMAIRAVEFLTDKGLVIDEDAIRSGVKNVRWPLRCEVVSQCPLVVLDVAHNEASIAALGKTLARLPAHKRILVFGATRDKEPATMIRQFVALFDQVILTQYLSNPRALPVEKLAAIVSPVLGKNADRILSQQARSPEEAWRICTQLAKPNDLICVTGSFFLAAEMQKVIAAQPIRADGSTPDRMPD